MNPSLEIRQIGKADFLVGELNSRLTRTVQDTWDLIRPRRDEVCDRETSLGIVALMYPLNEIVAEARSLLERHCTASFVLIGWVMGNLLSKEHWKSGLGVDDAVYVGTLIAGEGGILYRPARSGTAFSVSTITASLSHRCVCPLELRPSATVCAREPRSVLPFREISPSITVLQLRSRLRSSITFPTVCYNFSYC